MLNNTILVSAPLRDGNDFVKIHTYAEQLARLLSRMTNQFDAELNVIQTMVDNEYS